MGAATMLRFPTGAPAATPNRSDPRVQTSSGPAGPACDPMASDEDLMVLVAKGDPQAFAQLVQRHLAHIIRLASRVVGARQDGEEIAQEAFARVWKHGARWKPMGQGGTAHFGAWLHRITINLAIDRKRRPAFYALDDIEEPADESDDGFAVIHRGEVSEAVARAVSRLPVSQGAALSLCFFDGLSNREAADRLGITVPAIELALVRARRNLRRDLAGLWNEVGA